MHYPAPFLSISIRINLDLTNPEEVQSNVKSGSAEASSTLSSFAVLSVTVAGKEGAARAFV